MNCRKPFLLSVTLLAVFCLLTAVAWPQREDTDGIALLLKNWRWESDEARSTIDFSSDAVMLLDGIPREYRLSPGTIAFPSGDAPVAYIYDGVANTMTLRFGDGSSLEYRRTIASILARRRAHAPIDNGGRLVGKFCAGQMLNARGEFISRAVYIHGDATFDVSPRPTFAPSAGDGPGSLGTALLWGDRIILAYDDGTAAEAFVVTRDGSGAVVGFRYLREIYTMAACRSLESPGAEPQPLHPQETVPSPGLPLGSTQAPDRSGADTRTRDFGRTREGRDTKSSGTTNRGDRGGRRRTGNSGF